MSFDEHDRLLTSFRRACLLNKFKTAKKIIEKGVEINESFIMACTIGRPSLVRILLEKGADPTFGDNLAIRQASLNGHADVISLLLQDGRADPTAGNNVAIAYAIANEYADVVKILLQDGRVEVDELTIDKATTKDIKDMLKAYKYRVDGPEYCKMKENI